MELILAEQLLLLFLDDEQGSTRASRTVNPGLAGAVLVDLNRAHALDAAGGELVAAPEAAPDHPLLAAAHAAIAAADKPRDAKGWIARLPREVKPLRERTAARLVELGLLVEERRKRLGIIDVTRFPQADPAPARDLRERLRAILRSERQPTPQEAALISLLYPYEMWGRLAPDDRRKELKRRAGEVADGGVAAQGLDDTQQGIQAAVLSATIVAVIGSSAGVGV